MSSAYGADAAIPQIPMKISTSTRAIVLRNTFAPGRLLAACAALITLACGQQVPDDTRIAVDHYRLTGVEAADLAKPDAHRALVQLSHEPCNRDAMGALSYRLDEAGYRRESANSLAQFVKTCGRADGFLSAAAEDLMAVSDYGAAVTVANQLLANEPAEPDYYFARGRAYEGQGDHERALADYMQTIALIPERSTITSNLFLRAADMHAKAGRYCDAVSMIRMWMSADPERADNSQAKNIIASYSGKQSCPSTYASGKDSFARPSGNTIRVVAKINGVTGTFIVDTGATYVTLTDAFAHRARIDTAHAQKVRLQTANGPTTGLLTQATSVSVGQVQAADVPVSVDTKSGATLGKSVDGLLGQSFLSRFETAFTPTHWSIGKSAG